MDNLERRIFLTGLKIDLGIARMFGRGPESDPFFIGQYLLPAYHNGELDHAIIHGRLGQARG